MSYCVNEVRLMRRVGRDVCLSILPKPFLLSFSDHDTGCQMALYTVSEKGQRIEAWKGSEWFSSIYEFNDAKDRPGVQPGFEWAAPLLVEYFAGLQLLADDADARRAQRQTQQQASAEADREAAIAAAREAALSGDSK